MFSDFRLGRFAGGGMRRAVATFPRLCKPCLGITAGRQGGNRRCTERKRPESLCCSFKPQVIARNTRGSPAMETNKSWRSYSSRDKPLPRPSEGLPEPVQRPPFDSRAGEGSEFMMWVRSQAQNPPSHTVNTSLQAETAPAARQPGQSTVSVQTWAKPEHSQNPHRQGVGRRVWAWTFPPSSRTLEP